MQDFIFGDKVERDKIEQKGHHNKFTMNNSEGVSVNELDAAVAELRDFVDELRRAGVVAADGSVADRGAVAQAVQSEPNRLKALTKAIANGARGTLLSVARDGASAFIVDLICRAVLDD